MRTRPEDMRPFKEWLKYIGIEIQKPEPMIYSENDLFVLVEINNDGAVTSPSMTLPEINQHVVKTYGEQPLRYFNEYKRLKIIHLKSGTVRDLAVKIDL